MKKIKSKMAIALALCFSLVDLTSPVLANAKYLDNKEKSYEEKEEVVEPKKVNKNNIENFEELKEVIEKTNEKDLTITKDIKLEEELNIDRDLEIKSENKNIIMAEKNSKHFNINDNGKLTLENLELLGNNTSNKLTGGIENSGELNIRNCEFINNSGKKAGVIENTNIVNIEGKNTFSNNEGKNTGVIYNENGVVDIPGESVFMNNKGKDSGVIYNKGIMNISGWSHSIGNKCENENAEYNGAIFNEGHLAISPNTWIDEDIVEKIIVKFNSNGGTDIEDQEIERENTIVEPNNPTREGYNFLGWYEDKDLINKFDFNTKIIENTTLHAKWEKLNNYELKGNSIELKVNDDFNYLDLINIATENEIDVKEKVKFEYPEGINKDNITEKSGEVKIILTLGDKSVEVIVKVVDLYELKAKDFTYIVGEKITLEKLQKDLIEKATKNGKNINEEVNISFLDKNINMENLTSKARENVEVKLTLGNEEKTVNIKVKEKEIEIKNYTIAFNSNGGTNIPNQKINKGEKAIKPKNPIRKGYKFIGWTTEKDGNNLFDFNKIIDEDMTLYAKWRKIDTPVEPEKPGEGGNGGSNRPHKRPNKNKKDNEKEVVVRPQVNTGYPLDTINHMAYINGYEDSTFRPEKNVTREEVSTILYSVLDENYRNSKKSNLNNFKDVENKRWSNTEISTLANANVIKGYEDGEFKPVENMTRAEVSAVIARFYNLTEENQNKFSDTKGHWAEEYINIVAEKGLIKGYEDGSFKPDQEITRAEFVTLVNRLLERDLEKIMLNENLKEFSDVNKSDWYYEDILEAANGHEYTKENSIEKWTEFKVFNIK